MIRRKRVAGDLDLSTFMSLMVVLIPVLLAAAEFAKITVIDASMSKGNSQTDSTDIVRPKKNELLKATILVTDSVLTIGARGGFLQSLNYQNNTSWREAPLLDSDGALLYGFFDSTGKYVSDSLENISRSSLVRMPIPMLTALENELKTVQERYATFPDINEIVIGSEDEIVYDFLVQIMDVSKGANFTEVSFSKIRK